jgi:hypothetical protein
VTDAVDEDWNPLNVKEDFTSFGPGGSSALAADYPELMGFVGDDETAVTYDPRHREFGIPVLDGGGSTIVIAFDPWSGKALPASLRTRWFDELEALGVDPWNDRVPEPYRSEAWWLERGL